MAATVIWSLQALDDVDAIADYIHRDSPVHAIRVVEEIFALAQAVAEHPKIGRVVPELRSENIRERFLYSYRVIYEIGVASINILAVIHGKRLLLGLDGRFD